MYKIIGGDGNEYGPISAEVLRQWYAEGRVNGETRVSANGGEWLPMSAFPEFAALTAENLTPPPSTPPPFPAGAPTSGMTSVAEGDYELDIGGCIGRGWGLVKGNFWPVVGTTLLLLLAAGGVNQLVSLPARPLMQTMLVDHHFTPLAIGVFILVSLLGGAVGGVFYGGLFKYYLKLTRGEPAGVGDAFSGFGPSLVPLALGSLVVGALVFLCLLPVLALALVTVVPVMASHGSPDPKMIGLLCAAGFVTLFPMIYLQVSWLFTLPLIIDKQLDFWTAMQTSWRRVNHHWWQVFGLMIVAGLVGALGVLACCVGVFVTLPVNFASLMFAYETIFSGRKD
jgi:Membrane domain of glycerophosphoryl diester phosphodiesterase/GYF domain 2